MPWSIGGAAAILVLVVGVIVLRGEEPQGDDRTGRYTERELVLPGATFRFPGVEEELLTPQIRPVVDPEEPLPRERVERLKLDSLEALYTDLNPRVEQAVEDLLFED
ncbi:MAG: hypothetical protein WD492_08805 [Alkalispirochaeta sp.]